MTGRSLDEIIGEVTQLAEKVASPLGFEIVDVRMSQVGRRKSLQVTIYSPSHPVGLSDCESVSRGLEQFLDERAATSNPLIEGSYVLEVQSPGIERQLVSEREFRIFKGQAVHVRGKEKLGDLGQDVVGMLVEAKNGLLVIAKPQALSQKERKGGSGHRAKAGGKTPKDAGNGDVPPPQELKVDLKKVALVKLHPPEAKPFQDNDSQEAEL
ncbi:MAG TPA: hypothetical protein V6D17_18820 [Candidatus Obscuribacterales bacterium]